MAHFIRIRHRDGVPVTLKRYTNNQWYTFVPGDEYEHIPGHRMSIRFNQLGYIEGEILKGEHMEVKIETRRSADNKGLWDITYRIVREGVPQAAITIQSAAANPEQDTAYHLLEALRIRRRTFEVPQSGDYVVGSVVNAWDEDHYHYAQTVISVNPTVIEEVRTDLTQATTVLSVTDWMERIHDNAVRQGFWSPAPSFDRSISLVHSEASEAFEEYRAGHDLTEVYFSDKGKPEGVPSELADIVIRCFDIAAGYGIDLEKAIREKTEYNSTHPYKHGKQF